MTGVGAGISLPSSVSQLSALTLNNPSGLATQADLTIGATLTLTTGRLDAGANTVVVGAGGTVVRTGGWVVGRLQKHAAVGSGVGLTFEIGDATRFAPVDIAFGTVTHFGRADGEHNARRSSGHRQLGPRGQPQREPVLDGDQHRHRLRHVRREVHVRGRRPRSRCGSDRLHRGEAGWHHLDAASRWDTNGVEHASYRDDFLQRFRGWGADRRPGGHRRRRAQQRHRRRRPDPRLPDHGHQRRPVRRQRGEPHRHLADRLQPGRHQPVPGHLHARSGPGPTSAATSARSRPAGAPRSASPTPSRPPPPAARRPRPSASPARSSTRSAADNSATDTTTVVETAVLVVTKDDGLASVVGRHAPATPTRSPSPTPGPPTPTTWSSTTACPAALSAGSPSADLGGRLHRLARQRRSTAALPASLAPGATWTISVPYAVAASVAAQTVSNTAIATSDENPGG